MKRIILALAFMALAIGVNAQGITAANGTVVVKQGTVSVVGGITGTFVASGTGTTVISGTPTVAITGSVSSVPAITALTSSPSSVTTSGTVTAGAKTIIFQTSSDFVGSLDGLSFPANSSISYSGGANGTLPSIPYVVSAGTLYIRKLN